MRPLLAFDTALLYQNSVYTDPMNSFKDKNKLAQNLFVRLATAKVIIAALAMGTGIAIGVGTTSVYYEYENERLSLTPAPVAPTAIPTPTPTPPAFVISPSVELQTPLQ